MLSSRLTQCLASGLAVLLIGAASPGESRAALLPSGDAIWTFAATNYTGSIVFTPGSTGGTMTLTSLSTHLTVSAAGVPAAYVVDGPHTGSDTFTSEAFFDPASFYPFFGGTDPGPGYMSPWVDVYLTDANGTVFDGMTSAPVDPPPLSAFEGATLVFHYYGEVPDFGIVSRTFFENLTTLPEPSLVWLALAPLLIAVTRRRAPEA